MMASASRQPDAPIFIGGCPRSGTTLLRVMIDSHPQIACGPELRAIPALASLSADMRRVSGATLAAHYGLAAADLDVVFARLIMSFLTPLHDHSGKRRIAEKTPANVLHFGELARLFPRAAFVQVIRDGRDVVASLLKMTWTDGKTGRPLPITQSAFAAAAAWVDHIEGGRKARAAGADYCELRYEDLVESPRRALAPLFDMLGEAWSDRVLDYRSNPSVGAGVNESSAEQVAGREPSSRGRWQAELNSEQRAELKSVAGPLLIKLGYAADLAW